MDSYSLCTSLLKWLETFPGRFGLVVPKLTNGVVMAAVLNQIDPDYFTSQWQNKIKSDVGDNWRLKVSNLRKIQQGVVDYYQEHLGQIIHHFPLPDLNKIGEFNDESELGRLLQLILGCAINCPNKQSHIEAIMVMEESVQAVIMEAIQELMTREGSPGAEGATAIDGFPSPSIGLDLLGLGGPASFHPHLKTALEQLEVTTQAKEELVQRCMEQDLQISMLTEERTVLNDENEKLEERVEELEVGGDVGSTTHRYKDLKKQIDDLQDELFKLETSRDEYRNRVEVLERENQEVSTRNEELTQLADQARSLKDEVDTLRDMSERVTVYEGTLETYKKKLEELSDLKRQVKILEEKNSDYMQLNIELEEEIKKSGTWRPQLDMYKKQVAELHQKLSDEAKVVDRHVFDNKKITEKMESIIQEKERLVLERDAIKENLEELRCHITTMTSSDNTYRPPSDLSDVDMLEIIPHEIREKLVRLQHENRVLKAQATDGGSSTQLPVLQNLLSDLQERHNSLNQENRQLNQRIMELESEVEEVHHNNTTTTTPSGLSMSPTTTNNILVTTTPLHTSSPTKSSELHRIAELERKLQERSDEVSFLKDGLSRKDGEMSAMEERYKKYLGKAKSVIKTLDPKQNPNLSHDVASLRVQLNEKERTIENLQWQQRETDKGKMVKDMEEKLITTAFYNYGMQMHRHMIGQRLSTLDQGQSFLGRQRQTSTRRVNMPNVGNRHSPSTSQLDDMRIS